MRNVVDVFHFFVNVSDKMSITVIITAVVTININSIHYDYKYTIGITQLNKDNDEIILPPPSPPREDSLYFRCCCC